jgi:hypothetical protein
MKKLLIALSMLVFAPAANAGIMIEPFVGYESGETEQAGGTPEDYTGTTMGARLGYGMLGFSFGLHYGIGTGETDPATPPATDIDLTEMGLFASYEFPVLIRAYAVYLLSSKADADDGTGKTELEGGGMKLGVGFTGLPFVVINLEMTNRTFDEANGTALGANEIDLNSYALVVSIPLP